MAERKEGYWSRHHTGVIQCALGLYCAIFATWDRFHPRSIPAAAHEAHAVTHLSVGAAMTNGYSMPFWLWVGIIGLVLSVVIPAVLGIIRKWKKSAAQKLKIISAEYGVKEKWVDVTENLQRLVVNDTLSVVVGNELFGDPAEGKAKRLKISYSYGSSAVVKIVRYESNRMVLPEDTFLKERAENNHAQELPPQPLFTSLQLEAFQLVRDLRSFAVEVGPKPTLDMKLYDGTVEGNAKALSKSCEREELWANNLKAGYVLNFRKRVEDAYYRFVQRGYKSETLASLIHTAHSDRDIQEIVVELWKLAFLARE